jgi:hypothetical protein
MWGGGAAAPDGPAVAPAGVARVPTALSLRRASQIVSLAGSVAGASDFMLRLTPAGTQGTETHVFSVLPAQLAPRLALLPEPRADKLLVGALQGAKVLGSNHGVRRPSLSGTCGCTV